MASWTVKEFLGKGASLVKAHRMIPWMIGDLCNEFADERGEEAWQYLEELGISHDVLKDYMYVCDVFWNKEFRFDYRYSIWFFREVSSFGQEEGAEWVKKAKDNGWSLQQLRLEVRKEKARRSMSGSSVEDSETSSGPSSLPKKGNQSRSPKSTDA
jgi:hypothetical protein